jgi:hypothetical protein
MFETQMHFMLLIGNPIKRLKSRAQKNRHSDDHSHFYHSVSGPHLLTIPFIDQSLSHSFSLIQPLFFTALTQTQIRSRSTIPRSHSLSEAFCISVYHFVHAFINYLPIHFCITYSLLLRCNAIEIFPFNKTNRHTNFPNLFCQETVHISGSSSAHHQEFSTVHSALVYIMQV